MTAGDGKLAGIDIEHMFAELADEVPLAPTTWRAGAIG
jgi:hypothetical protein